MAFIILPIISLVLYIVGFIQPGLVLYMAVAGLAVALFSYNRCAHADDKKSCKVFLPCIGYFRGYIAFVRYPLHICFGTVFGFP